MSLSLYFGKHCGINGENRTMDTHGILLHSLGCFVRYFSNQIGR